MLISQQNPPYINFWYGANLAAKGNMSSWDSIFTMIRCIKCPLCHPFTSDPQFRNMSCFSSCHDTLAHIVSYVMFLDYKCLHVDNAPYSTWLGWRELLISVVCVINACQTMLGTHLIWLSNQYFGYFLICDSWGVSRLAFVRYW